MFSSSALPTLPPFLIPKVSLLVACEAPLKLSQLTLPLFLLFPLPGMSFVTGDHLCVTAQTKRSLTTLSPTERAASASVLWRSRHTTHPRSHRSAQGLVSFWSASCSRMWGGSTFLHSFIHPLIHQPHPEVFPVSVPLLGSWVIEKTNPCSLPTPRELTVTQRQRLCVRSTC